MNYSTSVLILSTLLKLYKQDKSQRLQIGTDTELGTKHIYIYKHILLYQPNGLLLLNILINPDMLNIRPAGQMWPAEALNLAR